MLGEHEEPLMDDCVIGSKQMIMDGQGTQEKKLGEKCLLVLHVLKVGYNHKLEPIKHCSRKHGCKYHIEIGARHSKILLSDLLHC